MSGEWDFRDIKDIGEDIDVKMGKIHGDIKEVFNYYSIIIHCYTLVIQKQ